MEELDTDPFMRARALLGDRVPIIEAIDNRALIDDGIWPFYMTRIPGKPWSKYEDSWGDAEQIKAAKSLGKFLAGCFVKEDTSSVVDTVIIPNLRRIRALDRDDREGFAPYVDKLITGAPDLKKLPSFLGHFDLNDINLLLDDNAELPGLSTGSFHRDPNHLASHVITFTFSPGKSSTQNFENVRHLRLWIVGSRRVC